MNLRNLTKKQKQQAVLAGIVVLVVLVVAVNFVLRPIKKKWTSSRDEFEDLSEKFSVANTLLKQEVELRDSLETMRGELGHAFRECIPDPDNSLSWVTQRVSQYARKAGVNIQSVSASASSSSPFGRSAEGERTFGMFAVNIMIECGYEHLLNFIREIETLNPYLCVSGLIISGQDSTPEVHNVRIELQWPIWADAEAAAEAMAKVGSDHG